MAIRVYLIEEKQMVREGVKALLHDEPAIKLSGEAGNLDSLRKGALSGTDVLLIEFTEGLMPFIYRLKELKKIYPQLKILVLSGHDDDLDTLKAILEAGAVGYLTKNASREELYHGIRKVMEGGLYVCTAFALRLLKNPAYSHLKKLKHPVKLTKAEHEVLVLIAEGLTNKEISEQVFMSVRTIETRRKKLLEKTATTNTATLIKFAVQHGLIS